MTHFPKQILDLPKYQGRFEAFKLAAQGCDVLFASYPAGSSIEAHTHDTDNVGMITQGELILTMNGQTEHFIVGEWYHVPAGVEHAARFAEETAEIEFWFVVG